MASVRQLLADLLGRDGEQLAAREKPAWAAPIHLPEGGCFQPRSFREALIVTAALGDHDQFERLCADVGYTEAVTATAWAYYSSRASFMENSMLLYHHTEKDG